MLIYITKPVGEYRINQEEEEEKKKAMEFDLEDPFTSCLVHLESDLISDLLASESDHLPSRGFVHCLAASDSLASFRQRAISLIVQAQFSCKCDHSVAYLAVNYMDRFMSRKQIMLEGNPWVLKLLVITCFSLASKMRNTHFSPSNFQKELAGDYNYMFDKWVIQRMELLVLDALDWRMRSITPFSFFPFLFSLLGPNNDPLEPALKNRAKKIVFKAQNETNLLEFKPSTLAASAILVAHSELLPLDFLSSKRSILSCEYVKEDKLEDKLDICLNALQGMVEMEGDESVLDSLPDGYHYICRTNEKPDNDTNSINSMVTHDTRLPEKRRKLN